MVDRVEQQYHVFGTVSLPCPYKKVFYLDLDCPGVTAGAGVPAGGQPGEQAGQYGEWYIYRLFLKYSPTNCFTN